MRFWSLLRSLNKLHKRRGIRFEQQNFQVLRKAHDQQLRELLERIP
jgi:hypothetical protein